MTATRIGVVTISRCYKAYLDAPAKTGMASNTVPIIPSAKIRYCTKRRSAPIYVPMSIVSVIRIRLAK